jgi:hydroxyethylthiazole kinase-like uncharacterized protein yjeF
MPRPKPSRTKNPGKEKPLPAADDAPRRRGAVYAFSRDALRRLDRLAVEEFSLPTCVLMENAAAQLFACVLSYLNHRDNAAKSVLILSGPGNNGGDGLALARLLDNASIPAAVLLSNPPAPATAPERYAPDARMQLTVARAMGLRLAFADEADPGATFDQLYRELSTPHSPPIIADCLVGTGLNRAIDAASPLAILIARINHARTLGSMVVAADVPSGLDADTGKPLGPASAPAVRAHTTVSFVGMKLGYTADSAREYLGEIMIADIGAPRRLVERLGTPISGKALFTANPRGAKANPPPSKSPD